MTGLTPSFHGTMIITIARGPGLDFPGIVFSRLMTIWASIRILADSNRFMIRAVSLLFTASATRIRIDRIFVPLRSGKLRRVAGKQRLTAGLDRAYTKNS